MGVWMANIVRLGFLGGSALLAVALVTAVVGARLGADVSATLPAEVASALAAVGGFGLAAILPFYLAFRLVRGLGNRAFHRPTATFATVLVWDLAVLAVLGALMPTSTGDALRSHGEWFLAGQAVPQVSAARSWLADQLSPVVVAAPTVAMVPLPAVLEPVPEPVPAVVEDAVWAPTRVFAERADSVVVVRVWKAADAEGPLAGILKSFGLEEISGQGSGFVVGPGLIVTNHHVIGDADRAEVVLRDGRALSPVEILAADPNHDLVLVRIPDNTLPAVPLAPALPEVGATCFAIGAPLGMSYTFTEGIVSAYRELGGTRVLQMQTPIAPGSSGGPLLDDRGRVVGVNTATYGAGLNMAVEVDYVRALLGAPQTPKTLGTPAEEPKLVSLTVEGELNPLRREQVGQVAGIVVGTVSRCVETLAPDARAEFGASGAGLELTGSNLGADAESCIGSALGDARMVARMLPQLLQGVDALEVTFDGIRSREPDPRPRAERTLTIRLVVPDTTGGR